MFTFRKQEEHKYDAIPNHYFKKSPSRVLPIILLNIFSFGLFLAIFTSSSKSQIEGQALLSKDLFSDNSVSLKPKEYPFEKKPDAPFQSRVMIASDLRNHFVTTPPVNMKKRILCKILKNSNCQSNFIADNVDLLWVIAPLYSFSVGTKSNDDYHRLHTNFKSYILNFGFKHITIEAIRFPNNTKNPNSREATQFTMTKPNNEPYDIQVYYHNISYIRENLLNVAIRKLNKLAPWEYVVWIDAHQDFENPYWWEEVIYKTEKFGAVQLFEGVRYLDYNNATFLYIKGVIRMSLLVTGINGMDVIFGNAWAATRDIYNRIGFIYDECIATQCDVTYVLSSLPEGVGWNMWSVKYIKNFEPWIKHTKEVFKGSRTFIRGSVRHIPHGKSFPYPLVQAAVEYFNFNVTNDIGRDANFSVYIKNEKIAKEIENVVIDFKNSA